MSMQSQLRRNQDTLVVVGTGIIAFGVWNILESVLLFVLVSSHLEVSMPPGYTLDQYSQMLVYSVVPMTAVGLVMNLFVGLSARAEGLGRRRGKGLAYVFIAVVMALFGVVVVTLLGLAVFLTEVPVMDCLIPIVMECTSIVVLVELVAASIRTKRFERQMAED